MPLVASVKPGENFRIECFDWTGGQIKNDDSANDVRDCNLLPCHHLSGPVEVEGREPGDILVVDILDIGPFQGNEWGYTGIFSTQNGGGFLTDVFPEPRKAIWDLQGHLRDVAPYPERPVRGHHPSRPHRLRCLHTSCSRNGTSARRAGGNQSGPRAAAGTAAGPETG